MNKTRFSSHWVVAQQGSGKTELFKYMIGKDLQEQCSIIVMDSKGALTSAIRKLALGDRLIVFDPDEPFAINPFDVENSDEAASHIGYMLGGLLDTTITQKQRTFFDSLVPAVLAFPKPSLPFLFDLLQKGPKAYARDISQLPPAIQDFFNHRWDIYIDTAKEMTWRLEGLLTKTFMKKMFSASKTRFRIADAMDQGKVIVIDNSQKKCKSPEGCGFIGRLFVSEIWAAGNAREGRPDEEKMPTYVYIDEAHLVIKKDTKIASIIAELRSQQVGLILAHQWLQQIEDPQVRAALRNCAIKTVNVPKGEDLSYFSELLGLPPERITDLPPGHFATDIRFKGAGVSAFPLGPLPVRTMTPTEEEAHKVKMRKEYGITSEGPSEPEPSRAMVSLPAEADTPIVAPHPKPQQPKPKSPRPQRGYPIKK